MGDPRVQMRDEVESLGINNTRMSFYVSIDISMDVILPFSETAENISVELPAGFAYVMVQSLNFMEIVEDLFIQL